jgi:hypothetical protein
VSGFLTRLFGGGRQRDGPAAMASTTVQALERPTPRKIVPEARVAQPLMERDELAQYEAQAKKIGYQCDPGVLLCERLKLFLAEKGILTYDVQQVHDYMNRLVQQERKMQRQPDLTWVWRPLREQDVKSGCRYQLRGRDSNLLTVVGAVAQRPYRQVIPASVLHTATKIAEAFPDVHFFVTDYAVLRPDPFLAVAVPNQPFLIVEFWNEPGFKPQG